MRMAAPSLLQAAPRPPPLPPLAHAPRARARAAPGEPASLLCIKPGCWLCVAAAMPSVWQGRVPCVRLPLRWPAAAPHTPGGPYCSNQRHYYKAPPPAPPAASGPAFSRRTPARRTAAPRTWRRCRPTAGATTSARRTRRPTASSAWGRRSGSARGEPSSSNSSRGGLFEEAGR